MSPVIAVAGVHVLDVHVVGVTSIPAGSEGQLVDTIRLSAAGTAGGTGVVLARLGAAVTSCGVVGDDAAGTTLLALLAAQGVDTSQLRRTGDAQSSASVIPLRPDGDRPAWHCIGANGLLTPQDVDLDRLPDLAHLHLGGPEFFGGPAAGEVLSDARARGASTSVDVLAGGDPGMLEWIADALPGTDYLLPNDEQVRGFTGCTDLVEGARALLALGARCVAVTQGAKGALVVTADEVVEVPAHPLSADELVDTTGCGDAFSAGFVLGRLRGASLGDAARLGCAAASFVARGLGTDAGDYDLARVQALAGVTP